VTIVVVPYHQDERLPDGVIPLPATGGFLVLEEPPLPEPDLPSVRSRAVVGWSDGRWARMAALHDAAADQIAAAVRTGGPATVLSGDCLIAMAALAGAQRAGVDPAVVWFDAHGDLHTLDSSTSGYLGGLSLRLVLGTHPELLAGPLRIRPVAEHRAVLVDARDLDPPEAEFLATARVGRATVQELETGTLPDGPLILHVDADVVDPAELPGLLFPAPGGPTASQTVDAVHRVLATGRVAVLNLACPWHPTYDGRVQQARTDLLRALIGGQPAVKNR
jgi:arginase